MIPLDARAQVGRLNGVDAEPGTILGPSTTGEWFVVLDCDERGVRVGFATSDDTQAAVDRAEPRSVAEHRLMRGR